MSRFNNKKESTNTVNLAGGRAISMNPEQELVHAVLTTFLEDKFYETGDSRLVRIQALIRQCPAVFVAQLAVVARTEFHLRSVSTALLGELSKIHRGDSLVKDTIIAATLRVDDLLELASYVGSPMPKQVKRGIRNALLKFDRYQLAKYKGEGKDVTLVDLFNLTHPKVQHASAEQKKAWSDLMAGKLPSFDTWETEISNSKDDADRKRIWESLIAEDKIGYMAILRNLNNLIKYQVTDKTIEKVVKKLSDPEEVKKSKQLPFRFVTAYDHVIGNIKLSTAISDGMEAALGNMPILPGKTLIALDTSGSMTMGTDPAMKKASVFCAALIKSNPDSDTILYDTRVRALTGFNYKTPTIDLAKNIEQQANGGGTKTSLVFEYAQQMSKKYDRIIILSDNESWNEHSVQQVYNQYKGAMGVDPWVYAIDIQGYGTKDIDGTKVVHLAGWSDRVLDFIGKMEEGQSLIAHIRGVAIPANPGTLKKEKKVKAAPKKRKSTGVKKTKVAKKKAKSKK